MKRIFLVLGLLLGMSAPMFAAEPDSNAGWEGVWLGYLDGQPSVTLTLAKDTGELGGTMVLNMMSREGGQTHVLAMVPHVLIHPRLQGDTLFFQLKRIEGSNELMNFTVALTADGKAKIHCLNCGADAPVVELEKAQGAQPEHPAGAGS